VHSFICLVHLRVRVTVRLRVRVRLRVWVRYTLTRSSSPMTAA